MRRHRLHPHEIPQTIRGLELCLREHVQHQKKPDLDTGIGFLNEAIKAFKPYFRMRENVKNKPAYPKDITWDVIEDYLGTER